MQVVLIMWEILNLFLIGCLFWKDVQFFGRARNKHAYLIRLWSLEFIALATCGREAKWIGNLLFDIKLWPSPMPPISTHCDGQNTMFNAYKSIYNGQSRQISLRHGHVKELLH